MSASLLAEHVLWGNVKKPSLYNFRCISSLSGKYEPRGKGLNVQSTVRLG
uniref:Uncharacterized protein n=1 Tax=Nelumbo nucifera TaxID=4432 RepID=A0A822Y908_NELNU|nr:TPA_asm: hypothetical protein HUJ06_029519 [Nelumbo nucifera]